jgi:metabolite-proton symporter
VEDVTTKVGGEDAGGPASMWRIVTASLIGTAIEWYDFFVYATAAALVLGQLFFPNVSPLVGTLAAFSTFAIGFVARPFGGLLFSHFGDKLGRKPMLILTLLLMGITTTLIGLLPTYAQVGVLAPILLVVLRVFQGMGAGAELSGAVLMAVEHSPRHRRGFYGSFPAAGVFIGILGAATIFTPIARLPEEQLLAWGWRIPFLVSIVLVGVGLYIRFRLLETPEFVQVKESGTQASIPALGVLRRYRKNMLLAMGADIGLGGNTYIFSTFAVSYVAQQLGLPSSVAITGVLLGAGIGIFTIPLFGAISDKVGRRTVYMTAAALAVVFAYPFFLLLDTEQNVLIALALVIGLALVSNGMFAPQPTFFAELFSTRVRYSGIVLSREITTALVGGTMPVVATALVAWSGGDPWPVALYMAVLSIIGLVCVFLAPETAGRDLSEPLEEVAPASAAAPSSTPPADAG